MNTTSKPTLKDLQEGRVTPEEFLASRNHYLTAPRKVWVPKGCSK